ncbi:MAG: hypothetical protein ACRCST_13505 [Turicibacter sp.]
MLNFIKINETVLCFEISTHQYFIERLDTKKLLITWQTWHGHIMLPDNLPSEVFLEHLKNFRVCDSIIYQIHGLKWTVGYALSLPKTGTSMRTCKYTIDNQKYSVSAFLTDWTREANGVMPAWQSYKDQYDQVKTLGCV